MADNVSEELPSCLVCGETENLKRCTRCRTARYCSKEHQVQHWKIHRVECVLGLKKPAAGDESDQSAGAAAKETDQGASGSAASTGAQAADNDDAIPFDERPLKLCDFTKPKSNKDEDMLEYCIEHMKKDGFCVLDNILTDKDCKKLLAEVKTVEDGGHMQFGKIAGGKASSIEGEMVVNQNIRGDKMVWLEGNEPEYPAITNLVTNRMDAFVLPLTAHFDGDIVLSGRTKAMVACYPGEGTSYHRHVDNPSKDGRIITCIFYLNKDWDPEKLGGVLRIFPKSRPDGDYVDVAPQMNRMLLFWSDKRTPHEVRPAYATRYAITIWYFNAEERALAKEAEVNRALKQTEKNLADVQLKTKQIEKEILEKKVAATTTSAIGMLSEDELKALTHMVSVAADPKAMLTQLGIAPVLQESLLQLIAERKSPYNITVLPD